MLNIVTNWIRSGRINRQQTEKSFLKRLYITVFHRPEPPRQGRRTRRRRRQPAGRGAPLASNVARRNNQGSMERGLHHTNDVAPVGTATGMRSSNVTVNKLLSHEKNCKPETPPEDSKEFDQSQVHSELQQHYCTHVVPHHKETLPTTKNENDVSKNFEFSEVRCHAGVNHGWHMMCDGDEEEQFEQSLDDLAAPCDYQEAVTLSLLIAEDILPRSLNRSSTGRKRRVSMIERFPIQLDSENKTNRTTYFHGNEKESSDEENPSLIFHQKRRHSLAL